MMPHRWLFLVHTASMALRGSIDVITNSTSLSFQYVRRCSNLVGVSPEQPLLYIPVVHLLIVVHQRPRGWYVAYATTQSVPRSRYPTFNKVTVVCIYSVCTSPNKLIDKANRYDDNNVDDVYLPRLGGFTNFVEDSIMCMPHHTYNF